MLFSKDARQSLYFSCFLPLLHSLTHRVACVTEGFSVCFFFCGSESKSYSCAKAESRWKQKTTWGRERGEKAVRKTAFFSLPSLLVPSPIVFFFVLGSGFARLNLFLMHHQRKNTPKSPPTAQTAHRVDKRAQFAYRSNRAFSDPAAVVATIPNRGSSDRYMIKKYQMQYFVLLVTLSRSP